MWKAGLSVVAKLNMARYSNRQRERIQNPSSVDSNSTRATTARCDEPPHFASTLTATMFNTCKGPVCCRFESCCPHQYADIAQLDRATECIKCVEF